MFSTRIFAWGKATDANYTPIQENNDGKCDVGFKEKRFNFRDFSIATILRACVSIIIVISVAGAGLFVAQSTQLKKPQHNQTYSCGNSSSEALALGCSFDQLMWSWYPPNCPHYTDQLFRTAEPDEPWRYYECLGATEPVPNDQLFDSVDRLGGIWTEKREHLTHCVYILLAQAQIIRDGTVYPKILVEYEHLEHCANVLLESVRKDDEWYSINTFSHGFHYDIIC